MDQQLMTALIGAGSGLIAGTLGSLVAPWVHWGIERRRALSESRRALLAEARTYVASRDFNGATFSAKPAYRRLKPYLEATLVQVIESYETSRDQQDDPSEFPRAFREAVLDELGKLEQSWGLI